MRTWTRRRKSTLLLTSPEKVVCVVNIHGRISLGKTCQSDVSYKNIVKNFAGFRSARNRRQQEVRKSGSSVLVHVVPSPT